MQYLRLLLYPFSLLYGLIIEARNQAYDTGIFASKRFGLPIICIGNLSVGGSGKSPMAEYIIKLLKDTQKVAVLSRGYGRKTKGFRYVTTQDTGAEVGDEPLQFRQKFSDITVAVCEKRVAGIEKLQADNQVIILDDAYQHRAVQAGLNILLFDYSRLRDPFLVFPAGNFREPFSGRNRAQVLVVTKTPEKLTNEEIEWIKTRVKPQPHQTLFFSFLDYGDLKPVFPLAGLPMEIPLTEVDNSCQVFLLTGIANPSPLVKKLRSQAENLTHYDYPDHHPFTTKNIAKLVSDFKASDGGNKMILTTEKDAQRLRTIELEELLNGVPVYYVPVAARFHHSDEAQFNLLIKNYVS